MRGVLYISLLLLAGCASAPVGNRGGVATIGKALLSPFKAIGEAITPAIPVATQNAPKAAERPSMGLPEDGLTLAQPDNPASPASQNLEIERTEEITFSKDTVLELPDGGKLAIPAGSKKSVRETRKAGQQIGASQKDSSREISARLASFKGIQAFGVIILVVAVIGFAHPAVRALIGGKDVAVALGGVGLAMIFGPAITERIPWWAWLLALVGVPVVWRYRRASLHEAQAQILNTGHNQPK